MILISIVLFSCFGIYCCIKHHTCENITSHRNYHLLPPREECGFVHVCGRIMGGTNTELGEFPWMTILMKEDLNGTKTILCGGSVINEKYIMTAAHCIVQFQSLNEQNMYKLIVRLGEHDLSRTDDCKTHFQRCDFSHIDMDVEEFIIHDKYHRYSQHDIALLRVKGHIEFNKIVSPICLPTSCTTMNHHFIKTSLAVAGWGNNNENDGEDIRYTDVLQKIYLHGVPISVCQKNYFTHRLTEKQLCAGGRLGGDFGKDTCHGDSGGPLMFLDDRQEPPAYDVVGIVSVGPDCSPEWPQHRKPGIYTRVGVFIQWILDHIRK